MAIAMIERRLQQYLFEIALGIGMQVLRTSGEACARPCVQFMLPAARICSKIASTASL